MHHVRSRWSDAAGLCDDWHVRQRKANHWSRAVRIIRHVSAVTVVSRVTLAGARFRNCRACLPSGVIDNSDAECGIISRKIVVALVVRR